MLGLNVVFTTNGTAGAREALMEEFTQAGLIEAIRNEEGCRQYEFFLSVERENEIFLLEKWETPELQKAHLTAPHMDEFRSIKGKYIVNTTIDPYEIEVQG